MMAVKRFSQHFFYCIAKPRERTELRTKTTIKKRRKTSIAIDPDVWKAFGDKLHRQGMNCSEVIELVAKQFIDAPLGKMMLPLPSPHEGSTRAEMHALLDEILDNGTRHIGAIQQNLELLAFALRLIGGHSTEELEQLRKSLKAPAQSNPEAAEEKISKSIKGGKRK